MEDTVSFICKTGGLTDVSVISLPTGTIYSFVDEDGVRTDKSVFQVQPFNSCCVISDLNIFT